METWQQALAQQRNPLLVLFNNFNSLRSSALLEYLNLSLPQNILSFPCVLWLGGCEYEQTCQAS